ncbi:MAG: glycosyltransferase [Pararhodobacter sp.]|nr:glycosyltransferase [Pararhodobacter sp.]
MNHPVPSAGRLAISVIIPANNEAEWIVPCLRALLASQEVDLQVVIAANACQDDTVARARALAPEFAARGWQLDVLDLPDPGKPGALNAGDAAACYPLRAYLDADVTVSPPLMAQLAQALATKAPRYASGTPRVTAQGWVARAYARFWCSLPFVADGVPGFGLFAVNAAGRKRWHAFPDIISDDTLVRLHFAPSERQRVTAPYDWPMVEGFGRLVRVRARQDRGVAEIARLYPALMANEAKSRPGKRWLIARALTNPLAFAIYAAVTLAVRLGAGGHSGWVRGR